jgi:predicted small metal-binding protein
MAETNKRGAIMAKLINCECGYVVRGETDEELVQHAKRHIEEIHPDLAGKVTSEDLLAMAEEE